MTDLRRASWRESKQRARARKVSAREAFETWASRENAGVDAWWRKEVARVAREHTAGQEFLEVARWPLRW